MAALFPRRNAARRRNSRIFRNRPNYLDFLTDQEIQRKYRLSKTQIYTVHELIKDDISPQCNRSHPLSPMTKVIYICIFWFCCTIRNYNLLKRHVVCLCIQKKYVSIELAFPCGVLDIVNFLWKLNNALALFGTDNATKIHK